MPSIALSREIVSCNVFANANVKSPFPIARASALIDLAVFLAMPRDASFASARSSGRGKRCVNPSRRINRAPEFPHELSCNGRGIYGGQTLPKSCAHGNLKTVPDTRHTQARTLVQKRPQSAIAGKMGGNLQRIRPHIENAPHPLYGSQQPLMLGKAIRTMREVFS